jgi:hypothetical protein
VVGGKRNVIRRAPILRQHHVRERLRQAVEHRHYLIRQPAYSGQFKRDVKPAQKRGKDLCRASQKAV